MLTQILFMCYYLHIPYIPIGHTILAMVVFKTKCQTLHIVIIFKTKCAMKFNDYILDAMMYGDTSQHILQ